VVTALPPASDPAAPVAGAVSADGQGVAPLAATGNLGSALGWWDVSTDDLLAWNLPA
jgi:hypothetical protein